MSPMDRYCRYWHQCCHCRNWSPLAPSTSVGYSNLHIAMKWHHWSHFNETIDHQCNGDRFCSKGSGILIPYNNYVLTFSAKFVFIEASSLGVMEKGETSANKEKAKKPPKVPRRRNNVSFSNYSLPPPPPRPLYSGPYNPYRLAFHTYFIFILYVY